MALDRRIGLTSIRLFIGDRILFKLVLIRIIRLKNVLFYLPYFDSRVIGYLDFGLEVVKICFKYFLENFLRAISLVLFFSSCINIVIVIIVLRLINIFVASF